MSLRFIALCFLLGCSLPTAKSQDRINVLTLDRVSVASESTPALKNEHLIRDEDKATSASLEIDDEPFTDLVYECGNEVVTIHGLAIATQGLAKKQASVEILASTLSATAGFQSLRVEPLRASSQFPQSFSFDPSAARWVIIRFRKLDDHAKVRFALSDLVLNGHEGTPVSTYQFNESPVDAIKVLGQLDDSIDIEISKEEQSLFDDAADGKFNRITFAEACLMSSGVDDNDLRQTYLNKIDQLHDELQMLIPDTLPTFEKGKQLLERLHDRALNQGYVELQTDVSTTIDTQTYNCVSSATLYNILARRMGLDARGIEVPDHAFSILYDGTDHVDIETTTRRGFNPSRNLAALRQFQSQTGFVYIPDNNRAKRREVGETGLVAITYYNHGVTAMQAERFDEALVSFFKSLSLDPQNKSAIKNILATLATWSFQLNERGDSEKAIAVLETGLALAPKDSALRHNHQAAWQRHLQELVKSGETHAALEQLRRAFEKTNDPELEKMEAWVFVNQGQPLVEEKRWEVAVEIADNGLSEVSAAAQKELSKWKTQLILRWSTDLLESEKFTEAIDVIEQGLKSSSDYRLGNRLAYLTQEYCQQECDSNGIESGQHLANELRKRFPKQYQVQRAATRFSDRAAAKFMEAKEYEKALQVYADARKFDPSNWQLKQSVESVWIMMAKPSLEAGDWMTAIDVYGRAYEANPSSSTLQQNLAYAIQEQGREIASNTGAIAAEEALLEFADRFPKVRRVQELRGQHAGKKLAELVKAGDFDEAHELLTGHRDFWPSVYRLHELSTHLYYEQAKPLLDAKEWEAAIDIFAKGHKAFPSNSKIKSNLEFVWMSITKEAIDSKDWEAAVGLHQKAVQEAPWSSKLRNNLRYCESMLKKTTK